MKKAILICLIFFLVAPIIKAEKKPWPGTNLFWEYENGVVTISGNDAIPSGHYLNFENRPKDIIPKECETIIIQEGATSIGREAFSEFDNLKRIVIPSTVMFIEKLAFLRCINLTSINIPDGVTSIEEYTFQDCTSLTRINIPEKVTKIGEAAFCRCENLKDIIIPNSVTRIERQAFMDCKSLQFLSLPNSVKHIGEHAFCGCEKLSITFRESVSSFGNQPFCEVKSASRIIDVNDLELVCDRWGIGRGLKDANGRWLIPEGTYYKIEHLSDGYFVVVNNSRYGLVNYEGKEIVAPEMEALESAGTGYLKYKINGFWGVMNYTGKIIIDTDRGYTSIGDFVTFTKRFPYTMAGYKGECDINGRQISKIEVEAPQQSAASSSSSSSSSNSSSASSSSSSNNNSGGGTTTVVVEHHRDPIPMQEWQACWACGGMGTMGCDGCGSSGTRYYGDRLSICGRCNGRGIIPCNICHGNKGQYITVYR